MNLKQRGCRGVDWRDQWHALVNNVTIICVPQMVGNFLTVPITISFLRRTLLHGVSLVRQGNSCM